MIPVPLASVVTTTPTTTPAAAAASSLDAVLSFLQEQRASGRLGVEQYLDFVASAVASAQSQVAVAAVAAVHATPASVPAAATTPAAAALRVPPAAVTAAAETAGAATGEAARRPEAPEETATGMSELDLREARDDESAGGGDDDDDWRDEEEEEAAAEEEEEEEGDGDAAADPFALPIDSPAERAALPNASPFKAAGRRSVSKAPLSEPAWAQRASHGGGAARKGRGKADAKPKRSPGSQAARAEGSDAEDRDEDSEHKEGDEEAVFEDSVPLKGDAGAAAHAKQRKHGTPTALAGGEPLLLGAEAHRGVKWAPLWRHLCTDLGWFHMSGDLTQCVRAGLEAREGALKCHPSVAPRFSDGII